MERKFIFLVLTLCAVCGMMSSTYASAVDITDEANANEPIDYSGYVNMVSPENPAHKYFYASGVDEPNCNEPNWSSQGSSTHQFIVRNACTIVNYNYSSSYLNAQTARLRVYSDLPDDPSYNQTDNGKFSGHFYNPDTGLTWTDPLNPGLSGTSRSATAKDRLVWWYNEAIRRYNNGNNITSAEALAFALHYAADLSEPHHATNQIAIITNHEIFEDWVLEHQNSYTTTSATSSTFSWARKTSIKDMGHNFAVNAKDWVGKANYTGTFPEATENTLPKAQRNCAAVIYKFLVDVGELS